MWYGKGPGVDRTGDVFRHANFAGSSKHGGVLALMGDDHTAEMLHHRASVRISLRRRDDPDPQSRRRAGDRGLRTIRLGDVALLRHLGRAQMHARDGGIDRRDRWQPRSRADRDAERFRDAGRRAQYPPERHGARPGSAALRLQARRDARIHPRQQAQPHHHLRRAERENRHHHHRQSLSRRAPGARRTRHRRGRLQRSRHPAVQDRLPVADQPPAN